MHPDLPSGLVVRGFTPPLRLADFRLAAFDMDSTLINIECIDEIAAAVGLKAEVAAITEATMRGEIADFKESLRRRVALLKGVRRAVRCTRSGSTGCSSTRASRPSSPALRDAGLKTLLVSGGFTFFSDRVARRLAIDYTRANVLEIVDGHLTGRVVDAALGRHLRRRREAAHAAADLRRRWASRPRRRSRWATAPTTCR